MTRVSWFLLTVTVGGWLAVGGLVLLLLWHAGVVVLDVEIAALVLVVIGGLLLADDVMGPRQ